GRALHRHAEALREHAGAPLTGDFDEFDEARPPPISEDQLYDVGEPSDPWVGEEELRGARSFPSHSGAWLAPRLGRLVRTDCPLRPSTPVRVEVDEPGHDNDCCDCQ